MIGERKDFQQEDFGTLVMRPYDIEGNNIRAFYDSTDDLVFVLDDTINESKPNVLLVLNPDGDKKWDEILSSEYEIDLETIRPKQDNKYQKLDIEYSGLGVYDSLINAYEAGESLEENLNQLAILRDSAARHSAMVRLNTANEIIAKTNATIVRTKQSIVRLQERLKTLRVKLVATKKEIGKVSTKQSASKVLKIESQIEAVTEKLNRAKSRLTSAQRRLEVASVDAELASAVLNRPALENKNLKKVKTMSVEDKKRKVKTLPVETEYKDGDDAVKDEDTEEIAEDDEDVQLPVKFKDSVPVPQDQEDEEETEETEQDTDVEPLFDEEPQIMDDKIAFKPVLLDAPDDKEDVSQLPVVNDDEENFVPAEREEQMEEKNIENKPVLESMMPVEEKADEPVVDTEEEPLIDAEEQKPVIDMMKPIQEEETQKPAVDIITPVKDIKLPSENTDQDVKLESEFEESEILPELSQDTVEFTPVETEETIVETPVEKKIEEKSMWQPVAEESQRPRPVSPQLANSPVTPTMPVYNNAGSVDSVDNKGRRPGLLYYLLLIILIGLSVFTLWLYQKNIEPTSPELVATTAETTSVLKPKAKKAEKKTENIETIFLDEEPKKQPVEEKEEAELVAIAEEPEEIEEIEEEIEVTEEDVAPVVEDAVPAHLTTSGLMEEEENAGLTEEEILASKPVFEPGGKDMGSLTEEIEEPVGFVDKTTEEFVPDDAYQDEYQEEVMYQNPEEDIMINPDSLEYDEEDAQYQAEQANMEYEE